jgi:hypothetical protein
MVSVHQDDDDDDDDDDIDATTTVYRSCLFIGIILGTYSHRQTYLYLMAS